MIKYDKLFWSPTWLVLLLILLLSAGIRYRMLDVPLERDEGEYAYAGQQILKGVVPYKQLFSMKLPGVFAVYAGMLALFGETQRAIHFGLLLVNSATAISLFFLGKRVIDPLAGLVAAGTFAVLSLGQHVQGMWANAEHFVILFVVAGFLLLLKAIEDDVPWLLFGSGLSLGLGFLMKQHGAFLVACGGMYLLFVHWCRQPVNGKRSASQFAIFTAGAVIPYGMTCLIMFLAGVFDDFWFWTFEYARMYGSQLPFSDAWAGLKDRGFPILESAPLIWMLSGMGLIALIWDKQTRRSSIFIALFTLCSFGAVCPGYYFRPHYFILMLPASALLAGVGTSALRNAIPSFRPRMLKYGLPVLLVVASLSVALYQQRQFLFKMTPVHACRETYPLRPFPESIEIARYIRAHTGQDDRIAVIGSEPQIYFYSDRRSASGYIYMYPLMEGQAYALEMQKRMIREIESVRPKFIIFVRIHTSWLMQAHSHRLLFAWFNDYRDRYYTLVGLIELFDDNSSYYLAPDLVWPPTSSNWIGILKRNAG